MFGDMMKKEDVWFEIDFDERLLLFKDEKKDIKNRIEKSKPKYVTGNEWKPVEEEVEEDFFIEQEELENPFVESSE